MVARNRIVLSGKLGAGAEDWSVSFHTQVAGGGALYDQSGLNTWAAATLAAFAQSTALMSYLGTGSDLTECSVYAYQPTGPAVAVGTATGGAGGTGTIVCPPQTALTISLLTGTPGARARGRVYWPWLVAGVGSALTLTGAKTLEAVNAFRAAANTAVIATQPDSQLVVYSPTAGVVTPVTTIRVGNVLDTQRRRRDRLVEAYNTAAM